MSASAYYNEIDPFAAQWLRNLIAAGHIAPGEVDERSIEHVTANDLRGFRQCHFFAGVGVWSYALRLAGWPDDRAVWTGSCPCQPFSQAGRRRGKEDERHLWPTWLRLIGECSPHVVFGEQVAGVDGLDWFDSVSSDLEGAGYAVGAADLCAAGVGAPHIRQRLYFVANAEGAGHGRAEDAGADRGDEGAIEGEDGSRAGRLEPSRDGSTRGLGNACGARSGRDSGGVSCKEGEGEGEGREPRGFSDRALFAGDAGDLADPSEARRRRAGRAGQQELPGALAGKPGRSGGPLRGAWADAEWIACLDGKTRPAQPGSFPLAHRPPARLGRLRAYGNAIVPQVASAFIGAYMSTEAA